MRAQVFQADGSKSGGEFLVNTTTQDTQMSPSVAALTDGAFTIAWHGNGMGDGDGVFARLFTAPPTITTASPPGTARPTFAGTARPGSTVTLMDGATVLGTAVADPMGNWSFTPAAPLAPGAHAISATADAAAMGPSAPSAVLAVHATPGSAQPIPTLGAWGVLLLSLLAGLLGWRQLRDKSASSAF